MKWHKFVSDTPTEEIQNIFWKIFDVYFKDDLDDAAIFFRNKKESDDVIYYVSPKLSENEVVIEFLKNHNAEPCDTPEKGNDSDSLNRVFGDDKMFN